MRTPHAKNLKFAAALIAVAVLLCLPALCAPGHAAEYFSNLVAFGGLGMAVTANQLISRQCGEKKSYPGAASTHFYGGTLVFLNASGYADDDTAAGVNEFGGIAIDEVDNSSGSNGTLNVECWYTGDFVLTGSGFAQSDVGSKVYASDNYTVTTSAAGNSFVGRISGYISTTKVVVTINDRIDPSDYTVSSVADDTKLTFGDSQDAAIQFSTADASNNALVLALDNTSQALHVTDRGAEDTDWNIAATTDPNIYIHSNTTPATDYLRIGGHTGTAADIDVVGGTTLHLKIAGTAAVDILSTGITLPAGQDIIFVGTTGQSEIQLTDNLADALSIKIAGGNDMLVFTSTDAGEKITCTPELSITTKITAAGSTFVPFMPMGAHTTAVAAAGAIPITNYYSTLDSNAGATTQTLADGAVVGQLKKIQLIVDGGDDVVTPAHLKGADTTITFADAGDFVVLMWDGGDWVVIEAGNDADGATAPVVA